MNPQALPPVPTSVNDIPPPTSFASQVISQTDLKDVLADPIHAYVKAGDVWQNFDRRNLTLSAHANWNLIFAGTISPETPLDETISIEEGVSTTDTVERMFATTIGVSASVPNIGLGTSISTTLSTKSSNSISISQKKTSTMKLTATTKDPRAVFWFWQLDVKYLLNGTLVTWEVNNSKGIGQLTGNDSRAVLTRDGEGRERSNRKQASGAKRASTAPFELMLPVSGTVLVTTQFPNHNSVDISLTDEDGTDVEIMSYADFVRGLAEAA